MTATTASSWKTGRFVATKTCETCEGNGGVESGPNCGWGCDWCGGCYCDVRCPDCDGEGEIEIEEY